MDQDARALDPLAVPESELGRGSPIPLVVVPDPAALVARFAADLLAEYVAARRAGRAKVVFIVPVGPVGQFDLFARAANAERVSLRDLVVINMDEYLLADGRDWIPETDPLSFRRHMAAHFYDLLDPALAPPPEQRIVPHPADLGAVPRAIAPVGRRRRLLRRGRRDWPPRVQRAAGAGRARRVSRRSASSRRVSCGSRERRASSTP